MDKKQASQLIKETFTQPFDRDRFGKFAANLLNHVDGEKKGAMAVPDAFAAHVKSCQRLAGYSDPGGELLDVLIVNVSEDYKIERTRTALRDFVAHKLKRGDNYKEAALVAFVPPDARRWRLSYVRMQYETVRDPKTGVIKPEERPTPARRFSYLVGEGESCHTAQTRFLDLLQDTATDPTLAQIEEAFSVEAVTKEFFSKYAELFGDINTALEKLVAKDKPLRDEFKTKGVNTVDFAKKLMGQIVFLYFLQKKGWLGVEKGKDWGTGPRDFLRRMARGDYGKYDNFFNDILEPLFYDTLATDRGHDAWCNRFKCRIPFLNGGLFEPLADYNWKKTDVLLPNRLFRNDDPVEEGITGTGILDVFDRYNFTVNEAEPLEKEVAIDPEMLGKVFENLIEENRRKGLGAFYTPREIVHYMCQESLINYLETAVTTVPRADIETFVHLGEQISHYEAVDAEYKIKMPKSIEKSAKALDDSLRAITVCDPAVGSGAFPVGMMTEVVRARATLTPYFNDIGERTPYHFKRHAIQNCLYGVDIDSSAVDIAKLRLWLSLVVDEEDVKQVKPLPNLDYKIVVGNSLIDLLSSAGLHASTDAVRTDLVNRLKSAKDQMFDLTSSDDKRDKREEIERLFQGLFEHDRKKQIEGIRQRLSNIRAQGDLFDGSSRKEQSVIHDLESRMKEVRDIRIPRPSEHFEWGICFSEVFQKKQGFDVVVANPPYRGGREWKEEEGNYHDYFMQRYSVAEYQFDIYALFWEQGVRLAANQGIICYITPNTWLNNQSTKKLRGFILEKTAVLSILDCSREAVFESVVVLPIVTVLRKAGTRTDGVRILVPRDSAFQLVNAIPQGVWQCDDLRIFNIFLRLEDIAIRQKLETSSVPLEKLALVKFGIKLYETGKGCPPQKVLDAKNRIFESDTKRDKTYRKYLEGKDVTRFGIHWRSRWLKYGNNLAAPRDPSLFHGARLLFRRIVGERLIGTFTDEDFVTSQLLQIVKPHDGEHARVLLAVLNSAIMAYYFKKKYNRQDKTFPEIRIYELASLPVPNVIPTATGAALARLVDETVRAKARDAEADVSALEREIDQIVYRLYGLTPDEIAQIEGALANTRRVGDGEDEAEDSE